ncbi:UNVERIFIED_CONTAM: hypothetical protein Sradi_1770500 [Sesamum radiatum]|uniref:Reverse transcriptase n=1 Tax=Sesamum radiatum TaxID=300843 RepID=A0AAW2TXW9_SESRA
MSQPELVELRKQLKEMLESGIIKPAKSPYKAPVLFQKKVDGSYICAVTIGAEQNHCEEQISIHWWRIASTV